MVDDVIVGMLPDWRRVLAVVAHPDDESFGLGGVLAAFAAGGSDVRVLCFTHGEASTLHGVAGDLAEVRAAELRAAAAELGLTAVHLLAYPDGALADVEAERLSAEVEGVARRFGADGLVAFDPGGVTGHPDHRAATAAAVSAAAGLGVGILGWTLPLGVAEALAEEFRVPFSGHPPAQIDVVIQVDRSAQRQAVACHPSQAVPGSALWRRLDLLGEAEHLRWLGPLP